LEGTLKKKVATFVIILVLAISVASAYYVASQDSVFNSKITPTPQPKATPTVPKTVSFDYSQTNIQYTDSTTIITLKIAFNAPAYYDISLYGFYLVSNGTKISDTTINRSSSGYPLTIDFIIAGHFTGNYKLWYFDSNATFLDKNV
jgi:hypothetical protein